MSRANFILQAPFQPAGDQPKAIAELFAGLERNDRFQSLLGVTGSGKTMTVANVIAQYGKPTLVMSHNKTLAAQLYGEIKSFFPHNAVEYFISYYDYYQPEAYVPTTDTYIEKDASINEDIDRLRLRATSSLMERDDVIIVATVSAIYGLGDPVSYREQMVTLLEAQRLESRTNFDIEMMLEIGTCAGIENYSWHLSGRAAGERPACLFDYFPEDFLVVVDESHVTLPQIGGMFNGDRARKLTLVDYGFRLPSALDNRPLMFDEFLSLTPRALNISATPAEIELRLSEGVVVEQIIRPTGLVDPEIEVRPVRGQVDDLLNEIRLRERKSERVLVTTLTKRMAEDLADC